MSRTWDENRETINGLWPMAQFTAEEADLWRSDLEPLNQDALFEAIRQVKRSRDSVYPQLAWVHDAYRQLRAAQRVAERMHEERQPAYSGERLVIDAEDSRRLRAQFEADIGAAATIEALDQIAASIAASLERMEAVAAVVLCGKVREARQRLEHPEIPQRSSASMRSAPRDAREWHGEEHSRSEFLRVLSDSELGRD